MEEKASKQNNTTTEKNTAEKDAHIIVSNESPAALTAGIISIVVINIFALLIGLYFWKREKLCFQKHTHKRKSNSYSLLSVSVRKWLRYCESGVYHQPVNKSIYFVMLILSYIRVEMYKITFINKIDQCHFSGNFFLWI